MPSTYSGWTRPSHAVLAALALLGALFAATFADGARLRAQREPQAARRAELARQLALTDLCLFTDARYTRHLSQADLHSAFQDYPASPEHFPSGSLVPPPATVNKSHADLDRKTEIPH